MSQFVPLNKTSIVLIQPTSLCNLNCRYCYVPDRKIPGIISDSVLATIFTKILKSPVIHDYLVVNWHAGEPLVVGIPFYKKAVALCNQNNVHQLNIKHVIQTNAVLITEEWCKFFTETPQFEVRVSIDGPDFLHDLSRRTWRDTGTHKLVLAGIEKLKKHNIPISVICVLTETSLNYPTEIFDFFQDLGITSLAFNLEEIEGTHTDSSVLKTDKSEIRNKYIAFFETFFSLFWQQKAGFSVREFEAIATHLRELQKNDTYKPVCIESQDRAIVTILKNGDVSTYGPELASGTSSNPRQFVIGNIMDVAYFEDIFQNQCYLDIQAKVAKGYTNCFENCCYFHFCGGGNPANKFYEHGRFDVAETKYCQLHRQTLTSVILNQLELYSCH